MKRILALSCVFLLLLIPAALADYFKVSVNNTTSYFQNYLNNGWGSLLTPIHYARYKSDTDQTIGYCLQHRKGTPHSDTYTRADLSNSYSASTLNGLYAILSNGYPYASGGLTAEKAFYATANAVRCYMLEQGETESYTMMDLSAWSDDELLTLAETGLYPNRIRVSSDSSLPVLRFMARLLVIGRNAPSIRHSLTATPESVVMQPDREFYTARIDVSLLNLRGGYAIDLSALPAGSSAEGFNGTEDETVTVRIPVSAVTDGAVYTLALTGYDDRTSANFPIYAPTNPTLQRIILTLPGEFYPVASASVALRPADRPMPDLTVSSIQTNRTSYAAGDTISVTVTVENLGNADAPAFDTTIDFNETARTPVHTPGLAAGASVPVSFTLTAPATLNDSMFEIHALTDCYDAVEESNEYNNYADTFIYTTAAKPDLTVASITSDRSSYTAGDTAVLTSVIRNSGEARASSFDVLISGSAGSVTERISSLEPDDSRTIVSSFTVYSPGKNTFTAYADVDDRVSESDETNNQRSVSFTVSEPAAEVYPDLTVTALTADRGSYDPKAPMQITCRVGNLSGTDAGAFDVSLSAPGIPPVTRRIPALAAGSDQEILFTLTAPSYVQETQLEFTAFADSGYEVRESDETNNTRTVKTVILPGGPDLTVLSVSANPDTVRAGEDTLIRLTVGNTGYSPVPDSKVRVSVDGTVIGTLSTGALDAGSAVSLSVPYTSPDDALPGPVTVTAHADPDDEIAELLEDNNILSSRFTRTQSLPDLTISAKDLRGLYHGETVVVTATVRSSGASDLESVAVQLQMNDTLLRENVCVPTRGENIAVFPVTLPDSGDTVDLFFTVDPYGQIPELAEDNNDCTLTLEMTDAPAGVIPDPDSPGLKTAFENWGKMIPESSDVVRTLTWQEYRWENNACILRDFYARLDLTVRMTPDERAFPDGETEVMESGFGVALNAVTTLVTNYDHPEKLTGAQRVLAFASETGFARFIEFADAFDVLEIEESFPDTLSASWQLPVNPYSVTRSRLHYVPLWYPDGSYSMSVTAGHAWCPAGMLEAMDSAEIEISGDMYDRVTAVE